MKLFLDTASIEEIREGVSLGVVSGVTTNPTLLAREGKPFKETIKAICALVNGPVSAEVTGTDTEAMVREGKEIASWAPNVVVKIPITPDGLKAVTLLTKEGIKVNVTLVFSPNQALLAALAGGTFVSPFLGRIDDTSHEGMNLVRDIVEIYMNYQFPTEIISASIRNVLHVVEAARAGSDIASVPFGVLKGMFSHPLTDIGLKRFQEDWEKLQASLKNLRTPVG